MHADGPMICSIAKFRFKLHYQLVSMNLLLFFTWLLIDNVRSKLVMCPVSRMSNFTGNHDHLYPIEIYHTNHIKNGVPTVPFETCRVAGKDHLVNFSCPLQSLGCPVILDNIQTGISISLPWQKATSVCTFKKTLDTPGKNVKVIVFGGSVTLGCDTTYCCPLRECEMKEGPRCAWAHYTEPWLRSFAKANVNVYNFGRGGTTSAVSAERLQEYMDKANLSNLTRNDIVFIDHSFNDNAMGSKADVSKLERGLEKLIRRLLTFTEGEIPTIILMETDTRVSHAAVYPRIYEKLAEHYQLRIYSYQHAVQTDYSVKHQKAFHHHLTHKHRVNDHPPWHTHLIYADFVSSLLLHEMSECDTTYKKDGSTPFVLPTAIYGINDSAHCSPHYAPLLRVSYDDIQAGTVIGEYSIPIKDTWQVRTDRKGRGAIMAELRETDRFEEVQNAPLWLTLTITVDELKKLQDAGENVVLQLSYLKSYFNAGYVIHDICGEEVFGGGVSALWNDWMTYHYTTTEIFTWYIGKCKQEGNEKVKIGIKHWIDPHGVNTKDMKRLIETTPKTKQLFEISSVVVCRYS